MTREELLRELRALPPEEVVGLLNELLDWEPAESMPRELWLATVDRAIERHREAWERLAKR